MLQHRGGNVFIWTLLWLMLVMGVLPMFIDTAVLMERHQALVDAMDSALLAVQSQHGPANEAESLFTTDLESELPQMPLRTMSFLDEKGTLTATVQMTVALPIIAGPWNLVTTQGSVSIT
ncbi:MAG: pilus assembly protein TadG-related protein [Sulfobacillus thermotolerans]|uniref:Flp pilus-assembly TadG-like N-terminal domain-containing protein n=1 Tax=Sulfobacillus thermotolerans TaxID=338644 RepID=A0ABN5H038_9FIRM|nr:hypothetical protein BXT84_09105 [Sulfobacillus thermotolerans]MCY0908904.1 pilus assembly protein TadG-related protein [Sulfobacillus thermotolerans]